MLRFLGWLIGGVLVLLALAAAALVFFDGAIRDEVEARVAGELRVSVPFTATPEVDIEGYPLVWHALVNSYPVVRVRGDGMPIAVDEQRTVAFRDVDMTLTDVSLGSAGEVRAASAEGDGVLGFDEITRLAGIDVTHAGGDRVAATARVPMLGISVTGTATGQVVLDRQAQTIALADPELEVVGFRLPDAVTDALLAQATTPIAVPLPYGLGLDAVTPGPDGLAASVVGTDVVIPAA